MNAAQVLIIALFALNIGITWAKHGKPETGKYNVWASLISAGIMAALLWWGGFWG